MYRYKAINIGGKKFDEHHVIMSKILDRNLLSKEIVHHKNENGYDNSVGNLQVMSLPEHSRMHMQGEKAPCAKLVEKEVREIFNSPLGCRRLARLYQVDKKVIQKIRNGSNWKHLNLKGVSG